ncbi:MAG TPA: methyltransferase [Candidatus Acidoferrales bacterium]|nr:methyltransferase [Candidatus Acidoferrales bacterium]
MRSELARWRVRAGYLAAVVYFVLAHPRPAWLVAGTLAGVAGLIVRGLAAGYLHKHEGLATTGPYACSRNPLYLGSALLAAGLAAAARSWLAAAVVAAYFLAFYPATIRSEESELAAEYGAAFREYAARVPLFWPKPGLRRERSAANAERFSWQQYRRNHEYNTGLGIAVAVLLLALKMVWGQ